MPVVAFVLVLNRIFSRLNMLGRLGLDDYSTLLAVFFITQCGATIAAVNHGYGRPLETLDSQQASQALKVRLQFDPVAQHATNASFMKSFFLLQIFYKLTINCTKISILFLYRRIFTDRVWFVRLCWALILVVVCACVSFTAATLLQCDPISGAWERWKGNVTCVDLYALWYSNAIYNILTDVTIVLMVPPVVLRLRLPARQKFALICVFGLGVIVCVASISRLTTLYSSASGSDATAGSFVSTIWTTIEAGLGIICANLPMLRTPLQRMFPKLFPSRPGTSQVSGPSGRGNSGEGHTLVLAAKIHAADNSLILPLQTSSTGINPENFVNANSSMEDTLFYTPPAPNGRGETSPTRMRAC
ncbi:hypothetical protein PV08_08046 [Exophiala spinifera]|uniref:Rhodopsin domain-containing protein n=1 Tax=Exophiala spinifera TaxID=91928 RepID=A0A0D2BP24_9EURO|nr:uncharacterized protein PV08_08046 [Exophiala spinifera]KIW12859.1 hypothetical protein PV08_08046 [Exophiala spinifera]